MVDPLIEHPLRWLPALALAALGATLAARGVRLGWRWAHHHDPAHNLRYVRGFRLVVIGLALVATGAAWQWHIGWLLVLALAIAFEELIETSIHAYAISRGLRLETAARALEASGPAEAAGS
jgi:hypothetical protein